MIMDSFSLGVFFAFISMISYGIYQFFLNKNVKNINIYSSLIFVHVFLIISTIPLLFFQNFIFPNFDTWLIIFLTALLGAINIPFLYKAIKTGKLSLVVPIANTYSLFAVIFSYFFFDESLKVSQYFFGLFVIIGMVLIVAKREELKNFKIYKKDIKPLTYALIFSIGLGLYSALLRPIEENIGPFFGTFYTETLILIFLGIYYFSGKVTFQRPKFNIYKFLFLAGFFQAMGTLFFFFGIKHANVSITSIIGAANPLIVLIFAYAFLKEKIEWNQFLGIIITIISLICLGL